jgi:hypothetical protein
VKDEEDGKPVQHNVFPVTGFDPAEIYLKELEVNSWTALVF